MSMRSALSRVSVSLTRPMESTRGATRYFNDGKRILSEEERAAETVYIQVSQQPNGAIPFLPKKMEREKLEKMKRKAEKEKAEKGNESADKKPESTNNG